jgi:hypothetical protein
VVVAQDTSSPNTSTVHPLGEAAELGIWAITVVEVISGDEANSLMSETNGENPAPLDSLVYVCARISARNLSDQPSSIQMVDFAATGSDGVLRRTQAVVVPEPMLQAVVEPGATTEGWIAATVDDPAGATLWFDGPLLGGTWSDAIFALTDGAAAPPVEEMDASDTDVGSDPASPAAIGDTVTVGGWEVTITDVTLGGGIFDIFDFRTGALGAEDGWINNGAALYVTVRNLNPFPAFFSSIALEIADFDGEPWDHTLTLTAPDPDVSREYLPGASGEGWVTFGGQPWTEYNLVKVSPFKIGGSARYITFGGTPSESVPEAEATAEDTEPLNLAVGDLVETSEDLVNLRSEPSATGEIIEELPLGTQMEISGESSEADNYTWYPVTVVESSAEGFVVQDFIRPVDD